MDPKTTVGEARTQIRQFLDEKGCGEVCANCPDPHENPRTGCCGSCPLLVPGKGCSRLSLLCLQVSCNYLDAHLKSQPSRSHGNALEEFKDLIQNVPFEPWSTGHRLQDGLRLEELPVGPSAKGGVMRFELSKEDRLKYYKE